jgi:hypothetical protein
MTGVRVPHLDDAPDSRDVMAGRLGLDREFSVRACALRTAVLLTAPFAGLVKNIR